MTSPAGQRIGRFAAGRFAGGRVAAGRFAAALVPALALRRSCPYAAGRFAAGFVPASALRRSCLPILPNDHEIHIGRRRLPSRAAVGVDGDRIRGVGGCRGPDSVSQRPSEVRFGRFGVGFDARSPDFRRARARRARALCPM